MIISAPTALYSVLLPVDTNVGNVTWNISSNDPPRSVETTALIPVSEELKPIPPLFFDPTARQLNTGEFIYNLSYTQKSQVGIGNKMFESGQILDFTDETSPQTELLSVPPTIELQQNTNIINVNDMGLTEEQIAKLTIETRKKYNYTVTSLNFMVADINAIGIQISDNQKRINETQKTYNASVVSLGDSDEITISLSNRLASLQAERTVLVTKYDSSVQIANNLYDQVLKIKELVR